MLHDEAYRHRWEIKQVWYHQRFPGQLLTTFEGANLSHDAAETIERIT